MAVWKTIPTQVSPVVFIGGWNASNVCQIKSNRSICTLGKWSEIAIN